jgi:thiamine pyrophosphate-dependent acetolactate synthase large subunit-like protein
VFPSESSVSSVLQYRDCIDSISAWLGLNFGDDPSIRTADVILVLDCDVPWINTRCKPNSNAKIFHIDVDPLKQQMPVFYLDAIARFKADAFVAIKQINQYIDTTQSLQKTLQSSEHAQRWNKLQQDHTKLLEELDARAAPSKDGTYNAPFLCSQLRKFCPEDTIWCIEAVTETYSVAEQVRVSLPGSWLNCGGGGLGWSGGAAMGIKLASDFQGKKKFVCQIVGDGSYLFSVPGSVYWVAKRYNIPILTIVLNNKGWHAPKRSLLLVHPDGEGSKVSNEELNISFSPTPDYAGIAVASAGGKLWAIRTGSAEELLSLLPEAVETVLNGTSVVLDAHINGVDGKYQG